MKKSMWITVALVLFVAAMPIYAQTGCDNSPENPTAVLALLGSAGAFLASMRGRFGRK
jgi:XrtJ-associated TM-motif-TM protein